MSSQAISPLYRFNFNDYFDLHHIGPKEPLRIDYCLVELFEKVMKSPKIAWDYLKATTSSRVCALVTQEKIETFATQYFAQHASIIAACFSHEPIGHVKLSNENSFLILKGDKECALFAVFKNISWKGGHKKVYLALEVSDDVRARAFTVTPYQFEYAKEMKFRMHPVIGKMAPLVSYHGTFGGQYFMSCQFASRGNMGAADLSLLMPAEKNTVAFKLLDKLMRFHTLGVHKDLNASNILLEGSLTVTDVYINDFGTSALFTEPRLQKIVSGHAIYLAPEILKRCVPYKGYVWSEAFESDLTFNDWILAERYQLGAILTHLYLNQDIFEYNHALKDPACYKPFTDLVMNEDLLQSVFVHIPEDEVSRLHYIYYNAFKQYYWTLLDKREDLPFSRHNTILDSTSEASLEFPYTPKGLKLLNAEDATNVQLKSDYDKLFQSVLNETEGRILLEDYISPDVYAEVLFYFQKTAHHMKSNAFYYLSKFKFENEASAEVLARPLLDRLATPLKEETSHILEAIMPLLDQDPTKRPSLDEVAGQLLEKAYLI